MRHRHPDLMICRFPQGDSWEDAKECIDILHLDPDQLEPDPKLVIYGSTALKSIRIDQLLDGIQTYNDEHPEPSPRTVKNIRATTPKDGEETIRFEFHPETGRQSERLEIASNVKGIKPGYPNPAHDFMTIANRAKVHPITDFEHIINEVGEIEFGPLMLIRSGMPRSRHIAHARRSRTNVGSGLVIPSPLDVAARIGNGGDPFIHPSFSPNLRTK